MPKHTECSECGKTVQLSRTSATTPRCNECRRSAAPSPRACIDCGREFVRRHGHICNTCTSARYRKRHGRKRYVATKRCGWCGQAFETTTNATTACCVTHGLWLTYNGAPPSSRELVHIPAAPVRWRSRFSDRKADSPWWRVIVQGNCSWCGDSFTALSTTGNHRYCSDRCARRAVKADRRRRMGGFAVSPARRRRLYERDGWTCQICAEPTSREYVMGDPWSPTLDHIEPQSYALIPDHSDSNLRTAHAFCNTYRSDGALTDEEVRSLALARR